MSATESLLADLIERMKSAEASLQNLHSNRMRSSEIVRLAGKREGVALARSYVEELARDPSLLDAALAAARAEGGAEALREAADDTRVFGRPRHQQQADHYEIARWLRDRAAALAGPNPEEGEGWAYPKPSAASMSSIGLHCDHCDHFKGSHGLVGCTIEANGLLCLCPRTSTILAAQPTESEGKA